MQLQPKRDPGALAEAFGLLVVDVAVFVVVVAAIYLPGRYLLVPAAEWTMDRLGVEDTIEYPLLKVLRAAVGVVALVAGANLSGFASFLQATEAVFAAATIALGFAAQDVLGNLVSGVFIVVDPEFNIGDWIRWKDREGIIEYISFRVTRVHTFDNELISVPNGELTRNAVVNPVAKGTLRVRDTFCVAYGTDIDRARSLLVETARGHDGILNRPAPSVGTVGLGDSCVELEARFWIPNPRRTDFLRIRAEFVEAVLAAFEEADVEMPYPTRELTGSIETRPGGGFAESPTPPSGGDAQ
jgi:small-conductance mechanosensitive channel